MRSCQEGWWKKKCEQSSNFTCAKKSRRLSTLSFAHFCKPECYWSVSRGAAGIASAVNDVNAARKQLEESQGRNKMMESIALGKGLYLKPYKDDLGLQIDSEV